MSSGIMNWCGSVRLSDKGFAFITGLDASRSMSAKERFSVLQRCWPGSHSVEVMYRGVNAWIVNSVRRAPDDRHVRTTQPPRRARGRLVLVSLRPERGVEPENAKSARNRECKREEQELTSIVFGTLDEPLWREERGESLRRAKAVQRTNDKKRDY